MALAPITRRRSGTRVKVVRPLRWLHSLVTERIAMTGRTTVIGKQTAVANEVYVSPSGDENAMTAADARSASSPVLAISQSPDLVSNILRSSVETTRLRGTPARVARGTDASTCVLM